MVRCRWGALLGHFTATAIGNLNPAGGRRRVLPAVAPNRDRLWGGTLAAEPCGNLLGFAKCCMLTLEPVALIDRDDREKV